MMKWMRRKRTGEVVPRCDTCKFWVSCFGMVSADLWEDGSDEMRIGECRRYPPCNGDGTVARHEWPHTEEHHWCGEFCRAPNKGVTGNGGVA
jgi:hypothetical protein